MFRWLFAPLAAMALMLQTQTARACSCAKFMGAVIPNNSHPAPTNTRVYIFVSGRDGTRPEELRATLFEKKSGKEVTSAIDVRAPGEQRIILLTPAKELAPTTQYVVKWGNADKLYSSQGFSTAAGPDKDPPTWKGIQEGTFKKDKPQCCDCSTDDPHLALRLDNSKDETRFRTADVTRDLSDRLVIPKGKNKKTYSRRMLEAMFPPAQLLAVWVTESESAIDYNSPPTFYEATTEARYDESTNAYLAIGRNSSCATPSYLISKEAKKIRVGIRPVDLAGNQGVPSEALFVTVPERSAQITPMEKPTPRLK